MKDTKFRNRTMNDLIMPKSDKQQVFMPSGDTENIILDVNDTLIAKAGRNIDASLVKEAEKRKAYNDNIHNHNELIKTFVPYQHALIRVFLQEIDISGKGLYTPVAGYDKVVVESANVRGAELTKVDNPFPFTGKAVIVALPTEINTVVKVGDIVVIPHLKAAAGYKGESSLIVYENFFVHPDSGLTVPTKDISSPYYGYAILPIHGIMGFIK